MTKPSAVSSSVLPRWRQMLPVANQRLENSEPAREPVAVASASCDGPTILCIEDNLPNYTLIEQTLEAARPQIRLLGAMQGQLGLDLAREQRPALILLDEWLRQIKADADLREIPVIMVTADATRGQARRLLDLGARAYLTKPLDIREFLHAIDEALLASIA